MIKFLTLYFLVLAIFLGPPTARGDISFDLRSATKASYMSFISQLRSALPTKEKVYNIPVLPSTASGSQWFTFIKLTNYADETITVAINVTNVYIVAYRTNDVSYFFDETPTEAFKLLFKGTQQITLPYSGNYDRLQTAAGKIRENIELGLPALSSAITNLVYYDYKSTAVALLVLIQSTAEAARYKHIEQQVARHVNSNFMPSQAIISLENNWAALSKQIQIAQYRSGQFENPVELINPSGERFQVTNVSFNVVKSNIALLLYYKVSAANDNNTPTMLPITTTISGRDETTVRMMPNNYGYKMERKWIGNGRDNYVTMKV